MMNIEQADWFLVQTDLSLGQDFKELFQSTETAR